MGTRRRGAGLLVTATMLVVWAGVGARPAASQTSTLPASLVSDFVPLGANYSGIRFYPSTDPRDELALNAIVQFDTAGQTLSFLWQFCIQGGPYGLQSTVCDLDYQPTAICRKNGLGPGLFVAGFCEGSSQVVVEEWTFADFANAVAPNPHGDQPVPALSMSIDKQVLLLSERIGPLFGMAYHPTANSLWLFEEELPRTVYELDLDHDAGPQYRFDASSGGWSALAAAGRITAGWIEPTAPDGGGFVVSALSARNWKRLSAERPEVFLLRDLDFDGAFDEAVQGTRATVFDARSYLPHSRRFYP